MTCPHPPTKLWTGFIDNIADFDAMWLACGACGRVLRQAPITVELEAELAAQREEEAA